MALIEKLVAVYVETWPQGPILLPVFWAASVQRLAQALGAYARLSRLPGNEAFAGHVEPALHMLRLALPRTGLSFPALGAMLERDVPTR